MAKQNKLRVYLLDGSVVVETMNEDRALRQLHQITATFEHDPRARQGCFAMLIRGGSTSIPFSSVLRVDYVGEDD